MFATLKKTEVVAIEDLAIELANTLTEINHQCEKITSFLNEPKLAAKFVTHLGENISSATVLYQKLNKAIASAKNKAPKNTEVEKRLKTVEGDAQKLWERLKEIGTLYTQLDEAVKKSLQQLEKFAELHKGGGGNGGNGTGGVGALTGGRPRG